LIIKRDHGVESPRGRIAIKAIPLVRFLIPSFLKGENARTKNRKHKRNQVMQGARVNKEKVSDDAFNNDCLFLFKILHFPYGLYLKNKL
jgi:hypothetical protein